MAEPCTQEEAIKFLQQKMEEHGERLHEGDLVIQSLAETADDTNEIVKKIDKRLFIDNGTLSIQTKLDRLVVFKTATTYIISVIIVMLSSVIGALILDAIRGS